MKKISFVMLLALAFLVLSCRTEEYLSEEANNSNQPHLTSKRISLSEAKHKTKLVPELEKAEVGMEALAKKNVQGKGVDIGNGITIDTQNVLYMENGPNYHTYTFNIQRSNSLPNTPVENLVLTPLPEGGYKAYIVAYNFTEAEKNTILNGGTVSVNGKSSVTPLEGTFASVMSVENCTMQLYETYTWCSEGVHNHGEVEPKCKAEHKSQYIAVMVTVCEGGNPQEPGIEAPIDFGSGEAGGAVPCSANGVYLEPQDPANTGCNGGVVTQPNLSAEYIKFNKVISELSTELQSFFYQPSNVEIRDYLLDYFITNNQSLEAGNFVKWSVNFLHQNQNVTWAQFQNWFIDGYSDTYRAKLLLLSSTEIQEFININTEIDASLYDEEFVKETNEAFVAFTSYADVETMTNAQMTYVFNNNCCAGLFLQSFIQEKIKTVGTNYVLLRKLYPSWSKGKVFWHAARETIHLFLDIVGTVPVIGEVCDITNGFIYTIEGDVLNASLSYAGAIPVAGWGATGAKFAIKTVAGGISLAVVKNVDGFYVVSRNQQLFRKVLGMVKGDGRIAHHIIPFALQTNPVIQKAMLSKNAFMINNALNGIPVSSAVHAGSHSNYDNIIKTYLNNWNSANPNATPDQAYNYAMFIIQKAKTAIQNNPNIKINDLSF